VSINYLESKTSVFSGTQRSSCKMFKLSDLIVGLEELGWAFIAKRSREPFLRLARQTRLPYHKCVPIGQTHA
jgi:hypothetical protein